MNKLASATHLTGQPRWLQLRENAVNCEALSRRSHTPVSAVMPDHGRGELSSMTTSTVDPFWNELAGPTVRQTSGDLRSRGAKTKPTTGWDGTKHQGNGRADQGAEPRADE